MCRKGVAWRYLDESSVKHLYVHIPFCRSRCLYCDFASEPIEVHTRTGQVLKYVEMLRRELREQATQASGYTTVYLGGGTPTILPRELLLELVQELKELATPQRVDLGSGEGRDSRSSDGGQTYRRIGSCGQHLPSEPEFTVEANPGTIEAALLEDLARAGVTRISLGIQSFSASLREVLGRKVKQEEIDGALAALREKGWDNWNLDLIFGIPGQTWPEAEADLAAAVTAGPAHISLYDLTYTASYVAQVRALMGPAAQVAAGDFAEQHYGRAVSMLEAAGYQRYEVSNFARPGYECQHNLGYWRGEDFVGVGVSAVSTVRGVRRTNPRTVAGYLSGNAPQTEELSDRILIWEKAMLGLRTTQGVEEAEVLPVIDIGSRDWLLERRLLERCCGKLRVNPGYLNVSNAIIGRLLVCPESS